MPPLPQRIAAAVVAALAAAVLGACEGAGTPVPEGRSVPASAGSRSAAGGDLDIGSWNIEWFGDERNGPGDEALQLANAIAMLSQADADVWGIAEIVDDAQWRRLAGAMPQYSAILATDRAVENRGRHYGATEQKLGVLYRGSRFTVRGARLILTGDDDDFAGRPPLEVRLRPRTGGGREELVVIVVHMKARSDESSWRRRQRAGRALKAYLDGTYRDERVIVIGDWNDGLERSIAAGKPSPYADFVRDRARYRFVSKSLADRGVSSTTGYGTLIDHHLATDELAALEIPNSAEVVKPGAGIRSYRSTTSDHFPVLSHFRSVTP